MFNKLRKELPQKTFITASCLILSSPFCPAALTSTEPQRSPVAFMDEATGAIFKFSIIYADDFPENLKPSLMNAATEWEGIIGNYLNGRLADGSSIGNLQLFVTTTSTGFANASTSSTVVDNAGYSLTTAGTVRFNNNAAVFRSDAEPHKRQKDIMLHEIGHVLGIGTGWARNGLYDSDAATAIDPISGEEVGRYTGVNALAAYREEFNLPFAEYVPVEKGYGSGSRNVHWDENDTSGNIPTGRVSVITGLDMREEVQSTRVSGNMFLSNTSRASLIDLGYNASLLPVPEPSTSIMLVISGLFICGRRSRS